MTNKNMPAFPKTPFVEIGTPQNGMTLRDYFAAKALPLAYQFWMHDYYQEGSSDFALRNEEGRDDFEEVKNLIAEDCYSMADEMMKARDQ